MKLPIIVCSIQPLLPEFIHMGSAVCAMQRPSTVCGCFVLFLRNLFAISVASETTFILHFSDISARVHFCMASYMVYAGMQDFASCVM